MSIKFCSLSSGSSGNCYFVGSEHVKILVDVGISCKKTAEFLNSIGENIENLDAILLTHEHTDHSKGLKIILKKYGPKLYVTKLTYSQLKEKKLLPDGAEIEFIQAGEPFTIEDLNISSYKVCHDCVDPLCYKISGVDGETLGIATDLGCFSEQFVKDFSDCSLLLIEANHDEELLKIGRYPSFLKHRILSEEGHLSNEDASLLCKQLMEYGQLKYIILGHLSRENNFPELAFETVKGTMEGAGYFHEVDFFLDIAGRDQVGKMYYLNEKLNDK